MHHSGTGQSPRPPSEIMLSVLTHNRGVPSSEQSMPPAPGTASLAASQRRTSRMRHPPCEGCPAKRAEAWAQLGQRLPLQLCRGRAPVCAWQLCRPFQRCVSSRSPCPFSRRLCSQQGVPSSWNCSHAHLCAPQAPHQRPTAAKHQALTQCSSAAHRGGSCSWTPHRRPLRSHLHVLHEHPEGL